MIRVIRDLYGAFWCWRQGSHFTIGCRDSYGAPFRLCLRCGKIIR